jgi:molybdate transport system regulatory protein
MAAKNARQEDLRPDIRPERGAPDTATTNMADTPPEACSPATVRLHLWLERDDELCFGMGRALLLVNVERMGSLKKAAESLNMSYRAAWGKLQQSERTLGVKLVESRGARSAGVRLTPEAKSIVAAYEAWFEAVERTALAEAQRLLPIPVAPFKSPAAAAHHAEAQPESGRPATPRPAPARPAGQLPAERSADWCQSSNMLKITY